MSRAMSTVLRTMMLAVALGAVAMGVSGCPWSMPLTDHFVRYDALQTEPKSELSGEWERYKAVEKSRLPKKQEDLGH